MAGRPIEIVVDANVTGVEDGAKDIAKSLERVEDALDDVQDKAQDTGRELEDALGDGAKDGAQDAVVGLQKVENALEDAGDKGRQLDRDLTQALDDVKAKASDAGRGIDDGIRRGTDGASAGLQEFKGEANSTAKESAASFDGSAESIAGAFQEVAANAFAGFGPAGALAGLAIAAGIGVAIKKAQELAEANTEAAEEAAELGREIYETGGALDSAAIADKIKDIAFALATEDNPWTVWANEAKTGIGEVKDAVEGIKDVDAGDIFRGLAGDVEASQDAYDQLTESIERDKDALLRMTEVQGDYSVALSNEGRQMEDSIEARQKLLEKLEESTGASETARAEVDFYTEAMGESQEAIDARVESQEEAADRAEAALEKEREALEAVREALEAQAEAQNSVADANIGATEAAIGWIETLNQATADITNNGQSLDLNTESGRANIQTLIEIANAATTHRDALIAQGDSVAQVTSQVQNSRDAFINAAIAAGDTADSAAAMADAYGLIPGNVETQVQAFGVEETKAGVESIPEAKDTTVTVAEEGTDNVQIGIDNITDGAATVKVTDEGDTTTVQGDIDALKGKEIVVDVVDQGDVATVQRDIDGLRGKDIPVSVSITNLGQIQSLLDNLTAPRAVWVTVNERPGAQV